MARTRTHVTIKPWATVAYLAFIAVCGLVALGYTNREMQLVDIEALIPGFYSHASNLLLSAMLVLVFGLVRIIYCGGLVGIALFALAIVAANYLYELGLTLWNTKDITDAHYGALGAAIAFVLVVLIKSYGTRPPAPVEDGEVSEAADDSRHRVELPDQALGGGEPE